VQQVGLIALMLLVVSCGAPIKHSGKSTTDKTNEIIVNESLITNTKDIMPAIPDGAVTGLFSANDAPFYAAVDKVDDENQTTRISFQSEGLSAINIPESKGATLQSVKFDGFEQDVLLVNSVYKDPIFRKFYLYTLKGNTWHPVVDGFILHVDNITDELVPIDVDRANPNKMVRSYSVFDMDPESGTKYTWILHEETVEVLNR
jgi:hypothetical protein